MYQSRQPQTHKKKEIPNEDNKDKVFAKMQRLANLY